MQELEEKYDQLLKAFIKKTEAQVDLKKINKEAAAVYSTKKEIQLEMGKHRRELLGKVANLYKHEKQ